MRERVREGKREREREGEREKGREREKERKGERGRKREREGVKEREGNKISHCGANDSLTFSPYGSLGGFAIKLFSSRDAKNFRPRDNSSDQPIVGSERSPIKKSSISSFCLTLDPIL